MALIQLLTVFISNMLDPDEKQPLSEHCSPIPLSFPALFLPAFQPDEEKGIIKLTILFSTSPSSKAERG